MPEPPLFASPRDTWAATITGAATQGDMTVANLLNPQPTDRCRFASLASMYIVLDLGSAMAVQGFWAGYSNTDVNATCRIRGATSEAGLTGTPDYDPDVSVQPSFWPTASLSTRTFSRPHHYRWFGSTQTYQWWRFDIFNAANPGGYGEFGEFILFVNSFQPTTALPAYPIRLGPREEPRILRAEGGPRMPIIRPRDWGMEFQIRGMTDTDAEDGYAEIAAMQGASEPLLVWLDPSTLVRAHQRSCYGLLSGVRPGVIESHDFHTIDVTIEEMP